MNVCFFAVGEPDAEMAEMAAEALRLTNPDAKAYVLTDAETQFKTLEPVRGHVSPHTLIYDRTIAQLHFLRQHREGVLFLDSDCIVNQPLEGVFEGPIALTRRVPPTKLPDQIYNGGVLYGEGHAGVAFWAHWVECYQYLPRQNWQWYGDQMLLVHLVPTYEVINVYHEAHNYVWTNSRELDEVLPYYVVHFKGPKRKPYMPRYLDTLKARYGAPENLLRSA